MSTVKDNIRRLTEYGVRKSSVTTAPDYEPQAAAVRKTGAFTAPISNVSSIASPLTEIGRTTYMKTVEVPAGAVSVDMEVLLTLTMTDANGSEVIFNFMEV